VGDRFSFTYWQSATSLSTVRRLRKGGGGKKVLVVADPVFEVADARVTGTMIAQAPAEQAPGTFSLMREVRDSLGAEYGEAIFLRLEQSGALVDRLQRMYGQNCRSLVGTQAREGVLKAEPLEEYGEVIFSTHGVLDGSVPWLRQPALVLSLVGNEEGDDGYLTMAEVMDLKLGAEVVGLMACESGAGRVISGEGVMGMGRAFQYAGARSVLASLWSVEDESTNLLAEAFLQAASRGEDRAQALTSARHHLRENGYDHPFFWAPFVLIGDR
jgi:CHAT domain-containing protein